MQRLLRTHHSLYILNNREQLIEFARRVEEYKHISDLLLLEGRDMLMTRRVAFNIWQYLSNDDGSLIVDVEQRMIYPATAFLLGIVQGFSSVSNFKHNYSKEPGMLFTADIYMTNALFYWYHEACLPRFQESTVLQPFLETDFYMLFVQQKDSREGYPREFAIAQAQEMTILMDAVAKDRDIIKQRVEDAIFEAKRMYNYLSYKGVYKKDEPTQ